MTLSAQYASEDNRTVRLIYDDGSSAVVPLDYPGRFREPGTSVAAVLEALKLAEPAAYVAPVAPESAADGRAQAKQEITELVDQGEVGAALKKALELI